MGWCYLEIKERVDLARAAVEDAYYDVYNSSYWTDSVEMDILSDAHRKFEDALRGYMEMVDREHGISDSQVDYKPPAAPRPGEVE